MWLVPPKDSQIGKILSSLTNFIVPAYFHVEECTPISLPHLTLTSDIPIEALGDRPQLWMEWLQNIPLALDKEPTVKLQSLDVSDAFFKKLTVSAAKDPLHEIAVQIRAAAVEKGDTAAAERWAKDNYAPHVSLLYGDLEIDEERRVEILKALDQTGLRLETEGVLCKENEALNGWSGGRIVLVSTFVDIKDWAVLADRVL